MVTLSITDASLVPSQQMSAVVEVMFYRGSGLLQGYTSSKEFIITQHPLPHTTKDFWRMVWDHNAQTVVMLLATHGLVQRSASLHSLKRVAVDVTKVCAPLQAEDEFVYWPNRGEPMSCEGFSVTLMGKDRLPLSADQEIGIHDFILEATQVTARAGVRVYLCATA